MEGTLSAIVSNLFDRKTKEVVGVAKVHVIIGEYRGVIDDIRAFSDPYEAEKCAIGMMKLLGIPLAEKERKEYFTNPEANRVHRFELEVE